MRGNCIKFILLCLIAGAVACSEDVKSVKGKLPVPPKMEQEASDLVVRLGNSASQFSPSALGNMDVTQVTKAQVKGLSIYVETSGEKTRYTADLVEKLSSGCEQSVYTSDWIGASDQFTWANMQGGDFKVRCLNANCENILFVIDRYTGGDQNDVSTRHILHQAGAIVLVKDPNGTPNRYVPMTASTEKYSDSFFVPVDVKSHGQKMCEQEVESRDFAYEPSALDESFLPNNNSSNDNFSFPNNNTFFGGFNNEFK